MFNALLVTKDDEGKTSASVTEMSEDQLPDGPRKPASKRIGWCLCPKAWTRAKRWLWARRGLPPCWR